MRTVLKSIAFALLAALSLQSAAAQGRMFNDLCALKGAECVYVGKMLMKTIGTSNIADFGGAGDISKYLDTLEVINVENKNDFVKCRQSLAKIVAEHKLEILTQANDDEDSMVIYGKSNGDKIKMLIINAVEPDQFTIICMQGDIPADAISDMAATM